jgi:hypothetical protein
MSAEVELSLALMAVLLALVVLEGGCLVIEVHRKNLGSAEAAPCQHCL